MTFMSLLVLQSINHGGLVDTVKCTVDIFILDDVGMCVDVTNGG